MSFDPSAIHDYHDKIRAKIEAGEIGFAQSVVNDVMVSYECASFRGPIYGYDPVAFGTPPRVSAILEQMIIDVARSEGIASPRAFSRAPVERLVADLRSFPRPTSSRVDAPNCCTASTWPNGLLEARSSSDAARTAFFTPFLLQVPQSLTLG